VPKDKPAAAPPLHERIFEILVDRVRDYAVFLLDPKGNIASWNVGARLLKGYLADEIVGRHFSVFYPPEAVAAGWPTQELKVATMQGHFEDEGWRVRKDGSRFWANVVITALRDDDGRLLGFSKITRDLSARRKAEEALRESEERFRLLVEGVQDYAVYMLDPDGIVTSWNAGAQKMKGYARGEILGRHLSTFYLAEDIAAGKPWVELATALREGRAEDEGWRVRKSGERFWARVVASPLYDAEGRLRGFAEVTQDLSQREYARGLERTAQRVNEFIAMLAHELRNPLAPIRTAVHLMERLPAQDPAQEEMRQTIERQSGHLSRIVDDMLDIARITRGTLSIERSRVDLAEAVSRAAEIAAPGIAHAGHRLDVDLPPEPLLVTGDLARLTQLLGNLLTNAARYTPDGGRITVRGGRDGGEAFVTVRDTGRGIAPDNLEAIFGMFVQGKEPLQRVGGGLGIGLALARRIAELHDGTLSARSGGEGKGAEFTLRLPAGAPAAEPAVAQRRAAAPDSVPAKRVLIVDDNLDAAATLDGLMRALGHTTRVAHGGAQALALAEAFHPQVVLLDLGLPDINGYEVARHLRERAGAPMKIVAVTGWGAESDRSRAREAGFDVHLVKPVDEAMLQRIVEENGLNGSVH
jgi:PAS domain S-box-containing protein